MPVALRVEPGTIEGFVGRSMLHLFILSNFLLVLIISSAAGQTEVKFAGQTEFFVNESSTTVIRLVIERTGVPANITAIVSLIGPNTLDFVETVTAAFIPATETNRTVFIPIFDDDLPEADETFVFLLSLPNPSPSTKLGAPRSATITILSNDNAFGVISFNMSSLITVTEVRGRNQSVPITLIREKGTYGTVIVTLEVVDGPNPPEEDIRPVRDNITFPPGRSFLIYNLTVLDDQIPENDEIYSVLLKNVMGGAEINTTRSSFQINIMKNDSPVRFTQTAYMVPETDTILVIQVVRGKTNGDSIIGSDTSEVSIRYSILMGNSTSHARLDFDFVDLQPNRTIVFPPKVYEAYIRFRILDDAIPEIAESFQIMLLEESLLGDAVLQSPQIVLVTIEPNDKPYGVLSINSVLFTQAVIINEDLTTRFEGITIVRNGGTHGNVSVNWIITRNSSDPLPVTTDLWPASGVLHFAQGEMQAPIILNIISDETPEEAETYLLRILENTTQGGAEVGKPADLLFYMQDSDDVYGLIKFHRVEDQVIESSPKGRFLSLTFARQGGTVGDVRLTYTALYIPAGPIDPLRAREGVLNVSTKNNIIFSEGKPQINIKLPIRNDAFLQNGAHFVVKMENAELVNVFPSIPPVTPRLENMQNISLKVTPEIANGEIGFISKLPIVTNEPEDFSSNLVSIPLHRDGTDGQATVFWSLTPSNLNPKSVTVEDLSPFNGSVIFLTGQSDTFINITIKADDIPELNESVIISLDRISVENQILKSGFTSCELIILGNDDPGGVFEFSPSSRGPYVIHEGDSVVLKIARSKGILVRQFLRYVIEPRDSNEFYGNTGILEFKPGEKEILITLLSRKDGIPELDETYCVVLSSHSESPSTLGESTRVNITIVKNDDPHGVIEFSADGLKVAISESKDEEKFSAHYAVVRNQGHFGDVSISWAIEPAFTNDISPLQGTIFFDNTEFSKNITIYSLPDEVPEALETFTITLYNATGGARLGNIISADLLITKNDDPMYFADPILVRVGEGEMSNFTVMRNGSADFRSTVMYATINGGASAEEGDFIPATEGELLVFEVGDTMHNISVLTKEDDVPETDEPFYILLYNATGDTVVYGNGRATIIIEANDDPNGIFFLEPLDKSVEEGKANNFTVVRQRGHFGNVSLFWRLLWNQSVLSPGVEFLETSGILLFMDGEEFKPISLYAISDTIPEFNEFYNLELANASGGQPGPGGQLAITNLNVTVMIPFNDDPFGVFFISPESLVREMAEDVVSEEDMSYITSFSILRQQGTFGDVRVGWEILSSVFPSGLPPMMDFILFGSFPHAVKSQPHKRHHQSGTDALYFSGATDAFGIVSQHYFHNMKNTLANFTFSAWVQPEPNTDGFIIAKGNEDALMYYGVKLHTNDSHVDLMLYYITQEINITHVAKTTALKYFEENTWFHFIITLDDGIIEFYLDGSPVFGGMKSLKGEAIIDGPGTVHIGAGVNGGSRYTGLMQDVRLYQRKLTVAEIRELHVAPPKSDLHPISGYLEYRQGETMKSFIVSAKDDQETEGEELFLLKLVSVYGGARISEENTTATLRIQKSDNANGLFGFTGLCIPEVSEEGSTISCVVERTRGALDSVIVIYTITSISPTNINMTVTDFANNNGSIAFIPYQTSEVLNLHVLDDDIPELTEHFRVTLVSAVSGDGKTGSTPTSGASIDPGKKSTDIAVKASDHPYGLFQFSLGLPPQPSDPLILPAATAPSITVNEEIGQIRLLVVRAQGLLERVMVNYRTNSMTAVSPDDYSEASGNLEFEPGERYKHIIVNITDDSVPELAKSFRVELFNPEGGVDELLRDDGSASGDGDMQFFLPAFHKRASLGAASHITVTIESSDDAHGVFGFSSESLFVNATEPEGGYSIVTLQVVREQGALSLVTLYWNINSDPTGDLVSNHGNITFGVGQRKANITLQISPDDIPELDKTFSVSITNVSTGRLGALTSAALTVLANDDPYGLFIFSAKNRPIQVQEETINITLTIVRLRGLMGIVRVTYRTMRDSDRSPYFPANAARATQGKDYVPISGSVIFTANLSNATIDVPILDDAEPEKAEYVFVELTSVSLIEGAQNRTILDSPRLGTSGDAIAQILINANDDAFGVLQLSSTAVRVAENYIGPIINVSRIGGMFGDVSVKFVAVPITAVAGEDYSVASSDVVLLDGETSKAVPIYIINDIYPEVEESFRVDLLNQTTGGASLGDVTRAVITIEASDDPYGSFVFQILTITVGEPESNSVKVNLPIIRNSGTLGHVTIQWVATINGQPATDDMQVSSGNLTFAPGETMQNLLLEVLADHIPEIEEVIRVRLTQASNGGSIGPDGVANIIIPANDNPHGTVSFRQLVYRIQEPLERSALVNIAVKRSGGRFGHLQILYSTTEIDVITLAMEQGRDPFSYYELPVQGMPNQPLRTRVNITTAGSPLQGCAAWCLKQQACAAFSFSNASGNPLCFWLVTWATPTTNNTDSWTYRKNSSSVSSLFSSHALAGSDYESITGKWATMLDGEEFANLTVSILTDSLPELDEKFMISLLRVELINMSVTSKNQPSVGEPNTSTVVIMMNGDAFGVFLIYSINPNVTGKGLYVEVQEQPQTTVELVIERREGSLGQVTVGWNVIGGTATKNSDFIGNGETLTFDEGETRKTVTLKILDDFEPEDDETILIGLTHADGGSRILPSSSAVTILILANDNVAGVISFQTASRSVIGREGQILSFDVLRTAPGRGNVTVNWRILGQRLEQNFANISGVLYFSENSLNTTLFVKLLDDQIPEEKDQYSIMLYNVVTQGVHLTGAAVLDSQGYEAVLTVEASDEPHGVLSFAPSSRIVLTPEANKTIQLFINREFGSLGAINVTYATVRGKLHLANQTEGQLAEPGSDFIPVSGTLILREGETSAAIVITILEDDIPELQEFFLVNLTSVVLLLNPVTSSPPRLDAEGLVAQIIIDANDGVRGVIEWQSTTFEINETQGSLTLVAYRNRGTYGNVSVFMYTQNLGAHLGTDFNVTSKILSFSDGERYKYIDITIFDDDLPEGDEAFLVILANPSFGLELGRNTTATVTIFANDDGHGILSFNNTDHFYLREPTALYLSESVATMYVVRDPAGAVFGTVTVQYLVTGTNASDASGDLTPTTGYIILEEGVRLKILQITALLDEEPEMDEQFIVTLLHPTGGARLGTRIQTSITVLQNQAPLGLFSIFPVTNRTNTLSVEEGNHIIYLKVSRSNGINMSVSVEWETLSDTAFGIKGTNPVLAVVQNFPEEPEANWCFFTSGDSLYGVLLRSSSSNFSSRSVSTLYQWRGVFVAVEHIQTQNPQRCIAFNISGVQYVIITHGEIKPSNNSLYTLTSGLKLQLVQTLSVPETSDVKHFSSGDEDYLVIASRMAIPETSQVFKWMNGLFVLHQNLSSYGMVRIALLHRGGEVYMAVSPTSTSQNSLLYTWWNNEFRNPREVPVNETIQVEAVPSGGDIYLLFAKASIAGARTTCEVFVWKTGQPFFRHFQSIPFIDLKMIHTFTPPSGFVQILLAGKNASAVYSWTSETSRFSLALEAPSANQLVSVPVRSFNSTKNLIALAGNNYSHIYELVTISNQSDYIPSSGELKFEPGDREMVVAINVLDDNIPEDNESFRVRLKNAKGGAEIGGNGYITIIIPSNDDAHGVIGFTQSSLLKQAEELEQDNLVTFSIERLRGTFGRVTVEWTASGSVSDVSPAAGVVTFSEGQVIATITLAVLADAAPELSETVSVTLSRVTTIGVLDSSRGAVLDQTKARAVLVILPNDSPNGVVGWHPDFLFVRVAEPEGNSTVISLKIIREQGFVGDIVVHLTSRTNFLLLPIYHATANQDYLVINKTVIILENQTIAVCQVAILSDDTPELDESFVVNITEVYLRNSSLAGGQPSVKRPGAEVVEITIEENDDPRGVVQFNVTKGVGGAVAGFELPSPQNILRLPVIRQRGRFGVIHLYWEATPSTASVEDFSPSFGNLTFTEGQSAGVIEIAIVDDDVIEFSEIFNVTLMRVTGGARLGEETRVTVNIPPNDSPVGVFGFTERVVTVYEPKSPGDPAGSVSLTVARSQGGRGAVRIIWMLEDAAKFDLSPLNGTIVFNETDSRKNIVLQAIQDGLLEGNERYSIQLIAVDNTEIAPFDGTATIIVMGDQGALGTVAIAPSSRHVLIGEPSGMYNGTASISLIRGPGIFGEIVINWNITPPLLNEFVETSGTLTMRDLQSAAVIRIQTLDDDIPEEKKHFQFHLTAVTEGGLINESMRVANITMAASDFPYGQFVFTQELLQISEEAKLVNFTVKRLSGTFGQVRLRYQTSNGTAISGTDFTAKVGELLFMPNETVKGFSVEIWDDDLPEGPEDFFLSITAVELQGSDHDFIVRENGLQIDQPPGIGNASIVRIIIMKSDNAEGIIEFHPQFIAVQVEEDAGMVMIPVLRNRGTYGYVTADFISHSISALPNGVDYNISNASVIFHHGQSQSFINVSITDDEEREFAELFEIHLVGATGGAVLGLNLVSQITIAKSDSPNGVVRFLNQSRIIIPNPNTSVILTLVLERTGGLLGDSRILWNILGPNSGDVLSSLNSDIGDPVNGSFSFGDGEGGVRMISLEIYPHTEIEVQEAFTVKLHVGRGESEIDPKSGNVTIIIQKFGDPNGIVQFAAESLSKTNYSEPTSSQGPLNITLFIKRVQGDMGDVKVYWTLYSDSDVTNDFSSTNGSVTIANKQSTAKIFLQLLPDDVPELDEIYMVYLSAVEGGAELDQERSVSAFTVFANDDPHGVFILYSSRQTIVLMNDLSRYFQINVTRLAGKFGNVSAEYRISSGNQEQKIIMNNSVGSVLIKDGSSYGVDLVPISNQVFLVPGFNFTLELTNVNLIGANTSTVPQILKDGGKPATVTVPDAAANSEVGFDSVAYQLTNISAGTCQALISRRGLYGPLKVDWRSGYPLGTTPEGVHLGNITPEFGVVMFSHGEPSKVIQLVLTVNTSRPESFLLHLSNLSSNVSGGTRLRSGFTVAQIEPLGVFQLAPSSRQVTVEEGVHVVSVHVQRLYGFQGNKTKVKYKTVAASAKAHEDFVPIENGEAIFENLQISAIINITIIDDKIPEMDEVFYVNLTLVELVGMFQKNPRLNSDFSVASITISANDITNGVFTLGPSLIHTEEEANASTPNAVLLNVRRTQGLKGVVKVTIKTFGGTSAQDGLSGLPFHSTHEMSRSPWASEGLDFEEQIIAITFQDGQMETNVSIRILDDDEPEGQEVFYVFLTDPQGGAEVSEEASYTTIFITGNDLQNGILGFSMESLYGMVLDEDSENRTVKLIVRRQPNRAFESVNISWRATFNQTSVELQKDGVNLVNELLAVSGVTTCFEGQIKCTISVEIKPDEVPEFETFFFIELYEVSAGAALNSSIKFAYIAVPESDAPRGLIYFALGSRVAVAQKKTTLITLQVSRKPSVGVATSVRYTMEELKKAETVGRTLMSPAIAGKDFVKSEGILIFEPGQTNVALDVRLTPDTASLNPFPKRLQVILTDPTGGAKIDYLYRIANITIVSDTASQAVWGLIDQLYQPLDEDILNRVLENVVTKVATEKTEEQLSALINIMDKITAEGEKQPLSEKSRLLFYDVLCSLANPSRRDTRGYSHLAEMAERYAFSLPVGFNCGSSGERNKTILDSCPYVAISAFNWYPQQVNGHKFEGKNRDFLQVPERLLLVPPVPPAAGEEDCKIIQFTEYSSEQWFLTDNKKTALSGKILSVSLKGQNSIPLTNNNKITYQIYASGNRIVPEKSLCLLWNQAADSWLSDGQFCKVVAETTDYVECACSHMSVYAVYAQTDALSSYNEAFFSAGFICISGFTLAILSHLFCSRSSMFAAKLLTHMMVASLGTQISFLISAYVSPKLSTESCSALGGVAHYLYLCQFSWMLVQAVNFWYVLVMNDEHTERRHLLFFILGWGLPALVVILLLVILRGAYHWSMTHIYGLIHDDICLLPNVYAALFTAALVPLVCLVVVFVVFIHAYQVTPQWKAYDDVFRGRTNAAEVPLVLYLFALISVTWLWGGLHIAYRHLWMLVLFVIFNSLQGLYVFVVYFILHNQLCCPTKASYSIEMNGHSSPGSAFFTQGSGMPPAGAEISKSTQNLISAMEEMPADWERTSQIYKQSPQNGDGFNLSGGYSNGSLVADEESQEFDDLIFALKAGSALNISDSESCHGSQDGGGMPPSQIVELRRIPIADTHL
ncbi:adhesion G-protein coupled receptor V1 [Pleurodeles waltl]|uniref:adhesion G-protein coupled receptor V1 n=1 Tax=Pleurodeles waltl TaxID=8319 RepID=UPI0037099CEC